MTSRTDVLEDNDVHLLEHGGQRLGVQARPLVQGQRQRPQPRPVVRVTWVAVRQDVAPRLLVQQPEHALVLHLTTAGQRSGR